MAYRAGSNITEVKGIIAVKPEVTKGTAPGQNTYCTLEFSDRSGVWNDSWQNRRLGMVESSIKTDGSTTMQISTYHNSANSTDAASILLTIKDDGTKSCSIN